MSFLSQHNIQLATNHTGQRLLSIKGKDKNEDNGLALKALTQFKNELVYSI